ncbi:PEP-CTERM sorting domain-containing protein [Planctomycetota bacterium]
MAVRINGSLEGTLGAASLPPSWQASSDSPDTVEPDYVRSGSGIYAVGSPDSPDGGTFVNARSDTVNEGFQQQVSGLLPDTEYTLTFFQSNSAFSNLAGVPVQVETGHWGVTFDGLTQNSPSLVFEGNDSQTWSQVDMTFTTGPSTTSAWLTLTSIRDSASGTSRLSIDGISLDVASSSIPEPTTMLLLVAGLAGVAVALGYHSNATDPKLDSGD